MCLPDFETRYYFTEINKGEGVSLPEPWNFRGLFQDYLQSLCQHRNPFLWVFELPGKGAGFACSKPCPGRLSHWPVF